MARNYPVSKSSSAPATGRIFYEFLMRNLKIPAAANHTIWYEGAKTQLNNPDEFAFRGDIPTGTSLELITLEGKPVESMHTFTGEESFVLVSDLSEKSKQKLGIPKKSRDKDKVYNFNFKPYEQLPELTKLSNELASLSVPKSISSYLAGVRGKVNYSERDVLDVLTASFDNLSGPEMMHFLHGNNLAWSALSYIREKGNVCGDFMTEFHSQNPSDFYAKDLGTVLPTIFFALAHLGEDPLSFHRKIDVEIYGSEDAATYMRKFMRTS